MGTRRRLPHLGRMGHTSPDRGACVMEYVSIAAGLNFTDTPKCVDEELRNLAIILNDGLETSDRNRLLRPWMLRFVDTETSNYMRRRKIKQLVQWHREKYAGGRYYTQTIRAMAEHLGELLDQVDDVLKREHRGPATLDELEVVEKQRWALVEERRGHEPGP